MEPTSARAITSRRTSSKPTGGPIIHASQRSKGNTILTAYSLCITESAPSNGAPTASKNFNRILFAAATPKEPPPILKYHFRQSKSGHDHAFLLEVGVLWSFGIKLPECLVVGSSRIHL